MAQIMQGFGSIMCNLQGDMRAGKSNFTTYAGLYNLNPKS